jgi:hypothetical protein
VERRHGEGGEPDEGAEPALQPVGGAFFLLDELFGPAQRVVADRRSLRPGARGVGGVDAS